MTLGAPRFQDGQHLRRLADAHIVRQAAAEAELAQELHPAQAFALVIAQLSDEARGLRRGLHAVEGAHAFAHALEHLVDAHLGLGRQQRIQQARLVALEAQVVLFLGAQAGQRRKALQPLLGQQAVGAVAQAHHGVAAPHGGQQLGQARGLPVVVHLAVEFEPVDAAAHVHRGGPRPAEGLALGLHVPAGVDQFADHLGHRLEAQAPGGGRVAVRAQAEFLELLARGALRFGVADQVDALLGEPESAAGGAGLGPAAPVVQQEERLKVLLAPALRAAA